MKFDIIEKIKQRHAQCAWRCQHPLCVKPSTEIAHRLSKGKQGRKRIKEYCRTKGIELTERQVDEIIHHKYNTVPTCKEHNSSVLIHISQTKKIDELLEKILYKINLLN